MKNPACVFHITRNADNERDVAYFIYDLLWRNSDEKIEIDLHQRTDDVLLYCSKSLDDELDEIMNEPYTHPICFTYSRNERQRQIKTIFNFGEFEAECHPDGRIPDDDDE